MKKVLLLLIAFGIFLFSFEADGQINSSIPHWIKNNAGWWADDQIDDVTFVQGIEYLISQQIILVSEKSLSSINNENIPKWIKNNAGWWAEGTIDDNTFVQGIEFLVKNGIITIPNFNCNENDDLDRNGIPDEIENAFTFSGMSSSEFLTVNYIFENKDWSNCIIQGDLSHYQFINIDFTNATFSNTTLFNSHFSNSTFIDTIFLNNTLHGTTFMSSTMTDVVFKNSDFYPNNWENPFFIFNYHQLGSEYSCFFKPCIVYFMPVSIDNPNLMNFYKLTFGANNFPQNLRLLDSVLDESDKRTTWRYVASFIYSDLDSVVFKNSDLSHSMFLQSKLSDIEFIDSNISDLFFNDVEITNTKINDLSFEDTKFIDRLVTPEIKSKINIINNYYQKISNPKTIDIDVNFVDIVDEGLINWSMDIVIHEKKLYVADTDDHTINVYDLYTLEPLFQFSSPTQHYCDSRNLYSKTIGDCPDEKRNLPTSLAIIDKNIFVAYGFQNDIQVFDMQGKFLYKFGEFGNQEREFNNAYRISEFENMLYVADSENHRIQIFDSGGKFIKQFSTNVYGNTDSTPFDLDIYNNKIFVADKTNSSILIFDIDGILLDEFFINSDMDNTSIFGIDVHDELMFVADAGNDIISILDLDGNIVLKIGKSGNYYGEFNHPNKVVSNGEKIFVADAQNYRIQVFDLIYQIPISP